MQKVTVNGIEVSYDLDKLKSFIENESWDEESYTAGSVCGGNHEEEWSMSKETFEELQRKALLFIEKLKDQEIFIEIAAKSMKINKNGTLNMNSRNIMFDAGYIRNYFDEYGSHSWQSTGLRLERTAGICATLVADSYIKHQSSF